MTGTTVIHLCILNMSTATNTISFSFQYPGEVKQRGLDIFFLIVRRVCV